MKITDLKVGDVVVTGDSYEYDLVRIISEPKLCEEDFFTEGFIEVEVESVNNPEIKYCLGGVPGSAYCPSFLKLEEWLSWYPPEIRLEKIKELKLA